jgi:GNAT superfamily N-acetyltransferase
LTPAASFHIRPADLGDLDTLVRHRRAMFFEIGGHDDAVLDAMDRASDEYFRAAIPNGHYVSWIAEVDGGRIAGSGGMAIVPWPGSPSFPATRRGWILGIYTEPESRRRGIARAIMEKIVDWCRVEGFGYVSLHASAEGRPLYESMGFGPTNEMRLKLSSPERG